MHLELNADERQHALDVLDNVLSELSVEIANTDRQAFRDQLKQRRAALEKLRDALRADA